MTYLTIPEASNYLKVPTLENQGNDLKKCSYCGIEKSKDQFYGTNRRKDGKYSHCKECHDDFTVKYRERHRKQVCQYRKTHMTRNILAWVEYFKTKYGENPRCQVCDKTLRWSNPSQNGHDENAVHFDHISGDVLIKCTPHSWYNSHLCNDKNIHTWESCGFGILCITCNGSLPTYNRIEWLNRAIKYTNNQISLNRGWTL